MPDDYYTSSPSPPPPPRGSSLRVVLGAVLVHAVEQIRGGDH